jgi:hypothetical protein
VNTHKHIYFRGDGCCAKYQSTRLTSDIQGADIGEMLIQNRIDAIGI